jgi:hypothetical protein
MAYPSPRAGRSFYRDRLVLAAYNRPPRWAQFSSAIMAGRIRHRGIRVNLAQALFFRRVRLLEAKYPPDSPREVWRSGHQRRAFYRNLLRQGG